MEPVITPPMIIGTLVPNIQSGSSSFVCHVLWALAACRNMLYGTTVVPMRERHVISPPFGTVGMQPRSSSPKSGRTMSIVVRKTIAIKVTHTLKSFSRYLTASPTKRRTIRTITPKIGAMILVGTPVSALAPIAVPVRSPPIYASPPMVIAMMTRPHKMFRRSGRSAKSCFMFSARPS